MENGNNNYSFTPITDDNSVNEIKNDFFGGSSVNESDTVKEEVPPILETPKVENEVKEEVTTPIVEENKEPKVVETKGEEPKVENNLGENIESSNNEKVESAPVQVESSVPPVVETSVKEEKQENLEENVSETPAPEEAIQEVNAPIENVSSEPVEVKIPEGLDEEEGSTNLVTETPVENNLATGKTEEPKKGRGIFDFFKVKDAPTVENEESSNNNEDSKEDKALPTVEEPKVEETPTSPVVDEVKTTIVESAMPEVNIPNSEVENTKDFQAETSNTSENELTGEIPLFSLDNKSLEETKEDAVSEEPTVANPVIEPVNEVAPVSVFNDFENKEEKTEVEEPIVSLDPPKEVEPIVKEVVVEKEKVVLGKKCPNCGEITADAFCPNCGFLVE